MNKVKPDLHPEGVFKGVTLLPGWLIMKDDGRDAGVDRFTWQMREEPNVIEDHKRFAKDLVCSLKCICHNHLFFQKFTVTRRFE